MDARAPCWAFRNASGLGQFGLGQVGFGQLPGADCLPIICTRNSRVGCSASLPNVSCACNDRRGKRDPARAPRAMPVVRACTAAWDAENPRCRCEDEPAGRAAPSRWLPKLFEILGKRRERRRWLEIQDLQRKAGSDRSGRAQFIMCRRIVEPILCTIEGRQVGDLRRECDSGLIRKEKCGEAVSFMPYVLMEQVEAVRISNQTAP